ncbi:MAG: hypothetical protein NTV63_05840 [Candidatus Woesearchaeota archaeon]|nr:hypothetical protein [Candidatus Woesearchaeota archaeon]
MESNERKFPVFIKIEEYRDIIDIAELIKRKVRDAKTLLAAIEDIKESEQSELEAWRNALSEIEKKIEEIDSELLSPGE